MTYLPDRESLIVTAVGLEADGVHDHEIWLVPDQGDLISLGVGVRVGTLDNPASITPHAAIFVAEKMPWVTLPEGIPHFESYYNPADLLPPDRAARFNELLRKRAATKSD